MNEEMIKTSLIDYILRNQSADETQLICAELSFADGRRRADLVKLSIDSLSAYEIKSKSDNLDKLTGQIRDYVDTFDFLILVVDSIHLKRTRILASPNIGIYIFDEGEIRVVRKEKKRKRLSKEMLLSTLPKTHLTSIAKKYDSKKPKVTINSKLDLIEFLSQKISIHEAREENHSFMLEKYKKRFNLFMKERGEITHPEDLEILTNFQDEELLL